MSRLFLFCGGHSWETTFALQASLIAAAIDLTVTHTLTSTSISPRSGSTRTPRSSFSFQAEPQRGLFLHLTAAPNALATKRRRQRRYMYVLHLTAPRRTRSRQNVAAKALHVRGEVKHAPSTERQLVLVWAGLRRSWCSAGPA